MVPKRCSAATFGISNQGFLPTEAQETKAIRPPCRIDFARFSKAATVSEKKLIPTRETSTSNASRSKSCVWASAKRNEVFAVPFSDARCLARPSSGAEISTPRTLPRCARRAASIALAPVPQPISTTRSDSEIAAASSKIRSMPAIAESRALSSSIHLSPAADDQYSACVAFALVMRVPKPRMATAVYTLLILKRTAVLPRKGICPDRTSHPPWSVSGRAASAFDPIDAGLRLTYHHRRGGCSSMAEQKLPKLTTRVRFPSPAPLPPTRPDRAGSQRLI